MASVTRLQRRYDRQRNRLLRTKDKLNAAITKQATTGRKSLLYRFLDWRDG
jgi:hypothetical protein